MLAILISWIVIFFALFSMGDLFISLYNYNKVCKTDEAYNIVDTFILGICFILIPLQLTSLWLPSNHYILSAYILIAAIYWIFNRKRLDIYYSKTKESLRTIKRLQILLAIVGILTILIYVSFIDNFYDAGYYHYQQVRWNEEYSIVPGLGNLEDRFGFNSNYLLLSAIFSFRFLFGEALYSSQSLLLVILFLWVFANLCKSGYNIKYIILLAFFPIILLTSSPVIADSSTDAIPLLCIFYFLSKTGLKPTWIKEQPLLAFLLPLTLVTFKLSTAVFCIVSLVVLISILKQKNYRTSVFLLSSAFLIVGLWCVRNVIITGYLFYPIHSIDLFSFDWRMPAGTVMLQKLHIYQWAKYIFDVEYIYRIFYVGLSGTKMVLMGNSINFSLFVLTLLSPLVAIYCLVKKKKIDKVSIYILILSFICIVFGMITAPDFRFINGYIFGASFLFICAILSLIKKSDIQSCKTRKILTCIIILATALVTINRGINHCGYYKITTEKLASTIKFPWSQENNEPLSEYKMGDITIYLTKNVGSKPFDSLPACENWGIPFQPFVGTKVQNIRTIETRSNTLQDGFRTKEEYIETINTYAEKTKQDYIKVIKDKYPEDF